MTALLSPGRPHILREVGGSSDAGPIPVEARMMGGMLIILCWTNALGLLRGPLGVEALTGTPGAHRVVL